MACASDRRQVSETHTEQIIVSDTDPEYIRINDDLHRIGRSLLRLVKLKNSVLVDKFEAEAHYLTTTRAPDFALNMKTLYHGSTAPIDQICDEGLDERLSRKGRFGRGIYFSDNPQKCCYYAEYKTSKPYLLVCRVILGDVKVYELGTQDPDLTREPFKAVKDGKRVYYDSVRGQPVRDKPDETEYVIYDQHRAVIDYIVYYVSPKQSAAKHRGKSPSSPDRLPVETGSNSSLNAVIDSEDDRQNSVSGDESPVRSGQSSPVSFEFEQRECNVPKVNVTRKRTKIVASATLEPDKVPGNVAASQTVAAAAAATATTKLDAVSSNVTSPHIVALKNLMAMKGKLPKHELDELTTMYFQTYGVQAGASSAQNFDQLYHSTVDDPVTDVMQQLIREFRDVTCCNNDDLCRQYIDLYQMDVSRAVEAYFDSVQ